jgi:hypothetical protein
MGTISDCRDLKSELEGKNVSISKLYFLKVYRQHK